MPSRKIAVLMTCHDRLETTVRSLKKFVCTLAFWSALSMLDKAVFWWHWGKWNGVWAQRGDIVVQGVVHGLAWCGVWMILEAALNCWRGIRAVKGVVAAGICLFEVGEIVCSSVFHVYMGGEWLVMLMTSSWDELCKFVVG